MTRAEGTFVCFLLPELIQGSSGEALGFLEIVDQEIPVPISENERL